jgi:hypothetical protein
MTFKAERRPEYGGVNVTDKYRPMIVAYDTGQKALHSKLITNRRALIRSANVLPQPLYLRTNWDAAVAEEAGHLPPLVVISTNRSQWIANGIEASEAEFTVTSYVGENDLNALTDWSDKRQASPIYAPRRTVGNRNIYIVVHIYEQGHYAKALKGTGIRVVGWKFDAPEGSPIGQFVGFGASRFAAIEFCKHLRTRAGNPWNYAWLLDDNVVGLTSFPGYAVFETMMAANPGRVCAGFSGGTKAEVHSKTVSWARNEVDNGRAIPAAALPPIEPKGGLVQQASLWNIEYLTTNKLNFAPAFVASGEDVSICAYFDLASIPYYYTEGCKVWKEEAFSDGSPGAKLVNEARRVCTKWFGDAEAATVVGKGPPPPVRVQSEEGGTQTLAAFITEWLSSDKAPKHLEGAATELVQQRAICHGVEQLVAEGAGKKWKCVEAAVLAENLKINGVNDQTIVRLNWTG